MEEFTISKALAQDILNYLSTQPYGNVWGLVQGLQAISPKPEESPEETPEEPITE